MLVFLLLSGCGGPLPIAEALERTCPPPRRPSDEPGDLARATVDFPGAVCNDGSLPAMYIRDATDPAHANDWVVYLEAGGGCDTAETCAARWCETIDRMTTDYLGERRAGEGILSTDPLNHFGGWNHVAVHYCTSDYWSGDRESEATLRGTRLAYTLLFRGHRVVEGAVATLEAGVSSDDGTVSLPSLRDAERVVLAGSSAGARGVGLHLDWFAQRLPEARVIGLMDSFAGTAPETMRPQLAGAMLVDQSELWDSVYVGLYDAFADADCEGSHACIDPWAVQTEQLDTPFVARRDLYDPLIAEEFATWGGEPEEVAEDASASMRLLVERRPAQAAVLGPACGVHFVTNKRGFLEQAVVDAEAGGPARTVNDLAWALMDQGEPLVAVDTEERANSLCE